MVIVSENQILLEYFDQTSDSFVVEEFDEKDSLLHYYTDSFFIQGQETTLGDIIGLFVEDKNSDELSKTVKSLTGSTDILNLFDQKIEKVEDSSYGNTSISVDWLEFSSLPIVGFSDEQKTLESFDQKNRFEFYEENWVLVAWKEDANGHKRAVNISSYSLENLLSVPVVVDVVVPIYGEDWEIHGSCFDVPDVSDIMECLSYEFYYYRQEIEEGKKKYLSNLENGNKDMITLKELLNNSN